ncbi:RidA family protein [Pantoea sp. 18069]|uniref:RidA family protein n=1 Tax=Pantoea sp. 18069 TaxID=2681415 RepID=UPI0013575BEA|nr:RidA family protein [Pantoea sp. 18069]
MNAPEITTELPPPLGKYPRFRRAGDLIYVSGVSARLPDGSIDGVSQENGVIRRDVRRQTQRVLENVAGILASAGASLADCIDITVFLTDQQDFAEYNIAYGDYFESNGPARTTVIVRGLPHPDMVVEVKAVAWKAAHL